MTLRNATLRAWECQTSTGCAEINLEVFLEFFGGTKQSLSNNSKDGTLQHFWTRLRRFVFGWIPLISLEDTTHSWLQSLSVTELKGLVNEVNHHLVEGSQLYHRTKSEVEQLNRNHKGLTNDH